MLAHPDLTEFGDFGDYLKATHPVADELLPAYAQLARGDRRHDGGCA